MWVRILCADCGEVKGSVSRNRDGDLVCRLSGPNRRVDPATGHRFVVDCCGGLREVTDRRLRSEALEAEELGEMQTIRLVVSRTL